MRKTRRFLLVVAILALGPAGYAGTVDRSYDVAPWPGFRTAAISYTFDDGCPNQLPVAVPLFNEFGLHLTLFTITGQAPDWQGLQRAADQGHEVAGHTVTHPFLSDLSVAEQTAELRDSQADINAHILGPTCLTMAYPYCITSTAGLCAQYYIAARGCQGFIEGSTPGDFMNVSSLICGAEGSVQTAADFNGNCETAASMKGWCVFLLHGIDNDGGYSPLPSATLRASLQYVAARRSTFWVETFGNVARYVRERNAVSVAELGSDANHVALLASDGLDDAVYNIPITLRRPLPAGWPSARVVQDGRVIPVSTTTARSVKVIIFDVLPNNKEVLLTRAPVPPAGLTAATGPAAINLSWKESSDAGVAGYQVYRSAVPGDRYIRLNPSLLTGCNYTDPNVAADKTFYYVVTAVDAGGYESGYSNEASARSPAACAKGTTSLLFPLGLLRVVDFHVTSPLEPVPDVGQAARTEEKQRPQHALHHG